MQVVAVPVPNKPTRKRRPNKGQPASPTTAAVTGTGAYHLAGDLSWGIPGVFGGRVGGYINDSVASGSGAYKVKSNSLMGALDMTGTVPKVRNLQKGEAFVLSHREFLKDIVSGDFEDGTELTNFTLEKFSLNPANPDLFPWLSVIAGNFQEYKVTGMLVEFKTTCSDLSTTLSLGTVILTADYNVLADAPINKQTMENMENAGSCKPSCSLIMPIECKSSLTSISNHLFVGPLDAADGDLRLYDHCNIFFASAGIPRASVTIGELWITYEIAFYKPKMLPFPAYQENFSWYGFWGSTTTVDPMNAASFSLQNNSSTLFEFAPDPTGILWPNLPNQKFLMVLFWDLSLPNGARLPSISSHGLTAIPLKGGDLEAIAPQGPNVGATYNSMMEMFIVSIDAGLDERPFLDLNTDGSFPPGTDLHIFISAWNNKYHDPALVTGRARRMVEKKLLFSRVDAPQVQPSRAFYGS
jgi:hypothetical protein